MRDSNYKKERQNKIRWDHMIGHMIESSGKISSY